MKNNSKSFKRDLIMVIALFPTVVWATGIMPSDLGLIGNL